MSDISYSFGPVPSRRLGKSLGINNIPSKVCTYSCVYCQVGRTTRIPYERDAFYEPDAIFNHVKTRLDDAKKESEQVDYLTFVPDGEPTLDINLGAEIKLLRTLNVPIGVISNSSLIRRDDVRDELRNANWVSLKIDAVQEEIWRKINRPHKDLQLSEILDGALEFSKNYNGILVTETMLLKGVNDNDECIRKIADFIHKLNPSKAYLSIPTRPPAEQWVYAASANSLNEAFQIFSDHIKDVEYLIGYEGDAFASTGDLKNDLLSITAVHPMREQAVEKLLSRAGSSWDIIEELINSEDLIRTIYDNHTFYMRKFKENK